MERENNIKPEITMQDASRFLCENPEKVAIAVPGMVFGIESVVYLLKDDSILINGKLVESHLSWSD